MAREGARLPSFLTSTACSSPHKDEFVLVLIFCSWQTGCLRRERLHHVPKGTSSRCSSA